MKIIVQDNKVFMRIHNGSDPIYESLIDNNTWSPIAYPQGWRLIN